MKKYIIILGNLDRRIIFLLIGLAVLIPLIKPNWVEFPIKIDKNTQIVYESISNLKENDKVLVSISYGASTKPEVHPMTVALLKHLFFGLNFNSKIFLSILITLVGYLK